MDQPLQLATLKNSKVKFHACHRTFNEVFYHSLRRKVPFYVLNGEAGRRIKPISDPLQAEWMRALEEKLNLNPTLRKIVG